MASAAKSTKGTVEGTPASLTYDGTSSSFSYRLDEAADGQASRIIEGNRIVGFLPRNNTSHEHVLLYVETSADGSSDAEGGNEKQAPVEARTRLRSVRLANPPDELATAFAPADLSWLLADHTDSVPASREQSTDPGKAASASASTSSTSSSYHKTTVIVSTKSGSASAEKVFSRLVEPFLAALGCRYYTLHTTSAESITEYTTSTILPHARVGRPQTLILLSGDGGPVDVLNALLASSPTPSSSTTYAPPTMALLPLGTGNALANSSNITSDQTLGLSSLLRGSAAPLPFFRATLPAGSYALDSHGHPATAPSKDTLAVHGAVVFSWALHAALVADSDTEAYRKHGAERFKMAAMENLFPPDTGSPHIYRGELSIAKTNEQGDGNNKGKLANVGDEHTYLLLTLCSHLEAAFCISPLSRPLDGVLRLIRLPPLEDGGKGVMRVMETAYAGGKHVELEEVDYEAVKRVELRIKESLEEKEGRWRRVCVDGKIFVVGDGDGDVVDVRMVEGEAVKLVALKDSPRGS